MVIKFPYAVRLTAYALIALSITEDAFAAKRIKQFSTTEEHYIDEFFYDEETGKLLMVKERGIPGDKYGASIDQTALIDWSQFDNNFISIKTTGNGYIPEEIVILDNDGRIAKLEIPEDKWSSGVTYDYRYDIDGQCMEVVGTTTYNGHVSVRTWTYSWENGNLVSYDNGYWNAEYDNTVYLEGARWVGAFLDSFAMRFRSSYIGIYCGIMPSSRHHIINRQDNDGYYDSYVYDVDADGYPLEIKIYSDPEMTHLYETFTFKWEDVAAVDDVQEDVDVEPVAYFTTTGLRLESPQNGLNIIQYSDHTFKKVLITYP